MTQTTYEIVTKNIDRVSRELLQAIENENFSRLELLSAQLSAIKHDLFRLLWIELPELNDGQKFKVLSKSATNMYFPTGIFELDAMRQAFFKRQAKKYFKTEEEQEAYMIFTEEQYLGATQHLQLFRQETKDTLKGVSREERKKHIEQQFVEAMSS